MKKILTAAAMAALVAGAASAVDFAGTIKTSGDLFGWDNAEGTKLYAFSVNNANNGRTDWGSTGLQINANGEKAGAYIRLANAPASFAGATVWVKPIDQLKLTVGEVSHSTNSETIDYSNIFSAGGIGYNTEFAASGLTLGLDLTETDWKYGSNVIENDKVKSVSGYASYEADFGKVMAIGNFQGENEKLGFGAGYSGSFGDVSLNADVAYVMTTKKAASDAEKPIVEAAKKDTDKLLFDVFAAYSKDALTVKAYVAPTVWTAKTEKNFDLGFKLYGQYKVADLTPSISVQCANVMKDHLDVVVTPKVAGSVGAASWNVAVKMEFDAAEGKSFAVAVPFAISLGL